MFFVHKSNRMGHLVEALARVVEHPLGTPLRPEIISVQSLGMRTWISMELARQLGILAHGAFPFPRDVIELVMERVLGESLPDPSPFGKESMAFSIMGLLPSLLLQPEFLPLRRYLEAAGDAQEKNEQQKRYALSRRIADLFDQYMVYRPDWLLSFQNRREDSIRLEEEHRFQPVLFRALIEKHGPCHPTARAERLMKSLERGEIPPGALPERVCLFGLSTLPPLYLDILARVAEEIDVHLFIFSPSREYWVNIRSRREQLRLQRKLGSAEGEDPDALHLEEGNPLLASLGHLGRDFQRILEERVDYVETEDELFEDPGERGTGSLLSALQSDILHLRKRAAGPETRTAVPSDDSSLGVHACHGRRREVEVVREALRHLFERDPSLMPHDVLVMAPEIEVYSPLVEAVFGTLHAETERIPYTVSDRSLLQRAATIQAFFSILGQAEQRHTVVEIFDLLAQDVIRERFELAQEEVDRVRSLAEQAGIRWGRDEKHRAELAQPPVAQNTWQFGLQRLFLGFALPTQEQTLFAGTLPYDEIEGHNTQALGRFAAFLSTLFEELESLRRPRSLAEWVPVLSGLLARMIVENEDNESQHALIRKAIQALGQLEKTALLEEPLELSVIQGFLEERLESTPSAQGFLSGGVTFCKLLPMRSIPFRVIVLLGMNDGEFPRSDHLPGFDLRNGRFRPGDRSRRQDDRYQFLEALLSAGEKLIITYVGQSLEDNRPMPPSVLVEELLDAIDEDFVFVPPGGSSAERLSAREALVLTHPLQAWSPRYFLGGDSPRPRLLSYRKDLCEAACSLLLAKQTRSPFLPGPLPLPSPQAEEIPLDDLLRFFQQPLRIFLQRSLRMKLVKAAELPEEREPMDPSPLERYALGNWLLRRLGEAPERSREELLRIARGKGVLPLGHQGLLVYGAIEERAKPLLEAFRAIPLGRALPARPVELALGGARIVGTLDSLYEGGRALLGYDSLKAKRILRFWIQHLVYQCLAPGGGRRESFLVGRSLGDQGGPPEGDPHTLVLAPLGGEAREELDELVRLYRLGLLDPLRFFPGSSYAYARYLRRAEGGDPPVNPLYIPAVREKWQESDFSPGEAAAPEVRLVFGSRSPLSDLDPSAATSFQSLSERVFGRLLRLQDRGE